MNIKVHSIRIRIETYAISYYAMHKLDCTGRAGSTVPMHLQNCKISNMLNYHQLFKRLFIFAFQA